MEMSGANPDKSSWPELVGVMATPAATQIAHDRPDVTVEVLPLGSTVTHDYDDKRVRVFLSRHGVVAKVPVIG